MPCNCSRRIPIYFNQNQKNLPAPIGKRFATPEERSNTPIGKTYITPDEYKKSLNKKPSLK